MKELKSLYNGIINDYSIQRYTLGWRDVVIKLESRYKRIPRTDEQLDQIMLRKAMGKTRGSLQRAIIVFAKERELTLESTREKNNRGTQRSPFGIGS